MSQYRGGKLPNGHLKLHDRDQQCWITERAAVNLVAFHSPELEFLRSSVLYTALRDFCVVHCNFNQAMQLVKDCQIGRGRAPTVISAIDGCCVYGNGVLDGRDGRFQANSLRFCIGTSNPGRAHTAALGLLRDAFQQRTDPMQIQAAIKDVEVGIEGLTVALQQLTARVDDLTVRYREARSSRKCLPSAISHGAAVAVQNPAACNSSSKWPILERAGADGALRCYSDGQDGLFNVPELLLQERVGELEGAYVLRFNLCLADGRAVSRLRLDEPSKLGGVDTGGHENSLPSGKAHS